MKTLIRKLSVITLVSVVTFFSSFSQGFAQDIEIFNRQQTVPNVLFVVDTSASMRNLVDPADPTGPTRLEAMQSAFASVLNETYETLNVGFMEYRSDRAFGVTLPVTGVNQLAQNVEPGVGDPAETYAQLLSRGVNRLSAGGSTPTVEALYEAALYFRGAEPNVGDQGIPHTSWNDTQSRYTGGNGRFAGLRTHENGTIQQVTAGFCLNQPTFLGAAHIECGSRTIDPTTCETYTDFECPGQLECPVQPVPDEGCPSANVCNVAEVPVNPERCRLLEDRLSGANYISPIQDPCTSNHIVLLSDGKPTRNHISASDGIRTLTGKTSCDDLSLLGFSNNGIIDSGECGVDLVEHLFTTDQSSSSAGTNQPGVQTIQTHAIGFQLDAGSDGARYLDEIALAGGTGAYIDASDPSTLVSALQGIVNTAIVGNQPRVISRIATTPDLSNLGATRPEVYMPLFAVETNKPRWSGNLKGFIFDANGQLVDTNADPVFDASGAFINNTSSFWSSNDGNLIDQGGLVGVLPDPSFRNLLTHDDAGDLIDLESGDTALNSNPANIFGAGLSSNEIDDLIDYINGEDVFDEDNDATTTKRNFVGDALHSNPVIVSYDETSNGVADRAVSFFMTNEGILHAVDDQYFVNRSSNTASEIFAYMPRELLQNIQPLKMNTDNTAKIYGLDGPLVFYQEGGARNIAGNKYLFFGMRRGGMNYYAMDVTDPDNPSLMWTIQGGTGDFMELGQSWSAPIITNVDVGGTIKEVMVIGGGYDVDQDSTTAYQADDQGRAIYMVDIITGQKVWSAGPSTSADTHDLTLNIENAIAADVTVVDFDNDGSALGDRIYFADVGGHIYRIDIQGDITDATNTSGYLFADLHDNTTINNRRFFSRPVASFTVDGRLALSIGSGNRAHPLQGVGNINRVTDRFYTLFDPNPGKLDVPSTAPAALADADLQDLTGFSAGFNTSSTTAGGWRVDLLTDEKVFTEARVLLNEIFFTTYLPPQNACSNIPDGASLYVLNLDGEPTRDLDATPDGINDAFVTINTHGFVGESSVIYSPSGRVDLVLAPNIRVVRESDSLEDVSWTNNPPPPAVVTP